MPPRPFSAAPGTNWPAITKASLHSLTTKTSSSTGEQRSVFTYVSETHVFRYGTSSKSPADLTDRDVALELHPVLDSAVYPPLTPDLPVCSTPVDGRWVEYPRLKDYDPAKDNGWIPKAFQEQAEVLRLLYSYPHRNLVKFQGCLARRGCVVGLVLQKCEMTLEEKIGREEDVERKVVMRDLKTAVERLHMFGLAHNDVHPSNVMFDAFGNAVLVGFGWCKPFGEVIDRGGRFPEWYEGSEEVLTSDRSHDENALMRIEEWWAQTTPTG
ncbi:hypothetical protein KVT40_001435 [Elsinoe batatas]|uniref:Protein kinase domain-containing protein n=1 Tax=Elsinoe batatas TaxID=2601811 RepID=A0A8K0L4N9_9PEZI|nr:hypothetical protein KVT40_001435 [Elsinoe batatas]